MKVPRLRDAGGIAVRLLAVLWGVLSLGSSAAAQPSGGLSMWRELSLPDTPRIEEAETSFLHYKSDDLLAALGEGWREEHSRQLIDHSGCLWSNSITCDLQVTLSRPRDRVLALTLRPHAVEGIEPQQVDVLWNNRSVGVCAFKKERGWDFARFELSVPAGVQRSGANTLTFLSRYALSAKDVGRGGEKADARRISFGLVSLQLLAPGEQPIDSLGGALPPPKGPASVFEEGSISLPPGTRVKVPIRLPPAKRCVLRLAGPGAGHDLGAVWLRWDTFDGVKRTKLEFMAATNGPEGLLEADLSRHAGKVIELVFDAAEGDGDKVAVWREPALWVAGPRPETPPPVSEERPASPEVTRVVVICLDALRANGLGHSGALRSVSPFVDQVARSGIAYRRAYASATWTYPSIVSLFTGLPPVRHGVGDVRRVLSEAAPTLQEHLKEAGCATGLIGENPFFAERYKLARGFDEYHYIFPGEAEGKERGSDQATPLAIEFLRTHVDDRFFLYVHYFPPHAPYAFGNPFHQTMTYDPIEAITPVDGRMHDAEIGRRPKSDEGVKQLRARYDENVRYIDDHVAQLFASMKDLGYGEETAIIITSDHGEAFDDHGHLGHSDPPYEALIRVPLIVHFGPEPNGRGRRLGAVARNIDLFPTICAWLKAPPPPGLPGRDLFDDAPAPSEGPLHFAQSQCEPPIEGYVWERYKLLRNAAGTRLEVYDLALDPDEQCNLAGMRPVLADYLLAQALAWRTTQTTNRPAQGSETAETDEQAAERLKALGYL